VGRLELIKGLQTLIPLWNRVEGHDLLVAGTGGYESQLRALAKGMSGSSFWGRWGRGLGALYYHATGALFHRLRTRRLA